MTTIKPSPATASEGARAAAKQLSTHFGLKFQEASIAQAAAIIQRYFPPTEATQAAEPVLKY